MRAEGAASFRPITRFWPITGDRGRRVGTLIIWAGSAARRFARALARRYEQLAPLAELRMIHRRHGGYVRTFTRVLAPSYHVAWRPNLSLVPVNSGSHRRLPAQFVERIRATTRTIIERSRRVETLARSAIRVLRTVPLLEARPVLPRRAPSPGWAQPPAMLIVRQRWADRAEPETAHPTSGTIDGQRSVAATTPLQWVDPATGSLPLGRLQIERLTEEVIRGIDRRFVSLRERMGRG
jgi:hypothetical protein